VRYLYGCVPLNLSLVVAVQGTCARPFTEPMASSESSLAASLAGLGVASGKLRNLLCDVVQLLPDDKGQDWLADAAQGLLLEAR
jgi:hypothetical protein